MSLKMSVAEMLKYREILEKKADVAKAAKKTQMYNAAAMRIDMIDALLDVALLSTISENAPIVQRYIDSAMIDKEVMKLVIGASRMKELPSHGRVNLQLEQTEEIPFVEASDEEDLKAAMREMLKRSFTKNMPNAIQLYREKTGFAGPNANAWLEIKNMLPEHTHITLWDRYLTTKLIEVGPVCAFAEVKKHLKEWDNMDIAILISDAAERTARKLEDEKAAEEKRKRAFGILEACPNDVKDYLADELSLNAIAPYVDIKNKTVTGRHIAEICNLMSPSKRAQIVTRREYVEKGY